MNRRSFLRIAGSTAVVVAAGAGAYATTRDPARARGPWEAAGQAVGDPRRRALSYAILAPNPHNRQPWMVDLSRPDEITLTCDPTRTLPETDPFNRQIVIGLGCFLELLRMAAADAGYLAAIEPFPEGEPGQTLDGHPIARVRFQKSTASEPDPLFRQVLDRRSSKEPFDSAQPVTSATLEALLAAGSGNPRIGTSNDPARVSELRDLTWRAHFIETTTPRTFLESLRLMRIGKAEIEANPDGIDLGGVFLETLNHLGLLTRATMADPQSSAFAQGMEMYRAILSSSMAYVWLVTDGNRRQDQLDAGRAWVRINLKATELGLGIHPISQALQEYPEMASLYEEIHRGFGATGAGQTVQMLGRLGYGPTVPASPRWPLASRIKAA